jgi:hypothetical protein
MEDRVDGLKNQLAAIQPVALLRGSWLYGDHQVARMLYENIF